LYNIELVRTLCKDIAAEKDAGKAQQLVSLLRAVIQDDQDEIRMRMSFLAKKYSTAANGPDSTA
jgi:hypothetical protein